MADRRDRLTPPAPTPAAIDWDRPWHAPWRAAGIAAAAAVDRGIAVAEALTPWASDGRRFVPPDALPPGTPYESHIRATGEIPTRDNLHDFFNGLVWHVFPATKRQLNRVQSDAIARDGIGGRRGPVRDGATLFDENGAVLQAPAVLWDALRTRDWHGLFVTHRACWADARLTLFGHALVEQLVSPRKGLTAHVLPAPPAIDSIADLDAWMAGDLSAERLGTKPFAPLPVLGVPGWWAANADPAFYDDPAVFRPPPTQIRTFRP